MKTNILALIAILFGSVQLATAQFDDLYYNPDEDAAELVYDDYNYDEDSYDYDDSEYDYDDYEDYYYSSRIRRFSRPGFSGFYNPIYSNYYYANRYNTRNWYADSYYNPRTTVFITFGNTRWANPYNRINRFNRFGYNSGFYGNVGNFGRPFSVNNSFNYYSYNSGIGNPCSPGYYSAARPATAQAARANANFGRRSYGAASSSTRGVRTTGTARTAPRTVRNSDRQSRRNRTETRTSTRSSNRSSTRSSSPTRSTTRSSRSSSTPRSSTRSSSRSSNRSSFSRGGSSSSRSSARSSSRSSSRSSGVRRGRG